MATGRFVPTQLELISLLTEPPSTSTAWRGCVRRARAEARREGQVPPGETWPEQEVGVHVHNEDVDGAAPAAALQGRTCGVRQVRHVLN